MENIQKSLAWAGLQYDYGMLVCFSVLKSKKSPYQVPVLVVLMVLIFRLESTRPELGVVLIVHYTQSQRLDLYHERANHLLEARINFYFTWSFVAC